MGPRGKGILLSVLSALFPKNSMDLYFSKNKKLKPDTAPRLSHLAPTKVWHAILVGFFIFFALTIGYSYTVLYRVSRFDYSQEALALTIQQKGPIDTKKLHAVLLDFTDRAMLFEKIKATKPAVTDPNQYGPDVQ